MMRIKCDAPLAGQARRVKKLALIVGLAACSSGGPKKSGPEGDPAATGSGSAAGGAPAIVDDAATTAAATGAAANAGSGDGAGSGDAGASGPVGPAGSPPPVAATAAPTTCALGAAVALVKASRTPGELDVAVRGERTAVAWADGGTSYLMVVDASGAPVAPAARLTPKGSYVKETHLLATPSGFVVVTAEDQIHCYLRARTLDDAGHLGDAVTLDKNVCSIAGYPQVASRGELVLVLTTHGYEGLGIDLVRWSAGSTRAIATVRPSSQGAGPRALSATADGFAALWAEGDDPGSLERIRTAPVDAAGAPGTPVRFSAGDDALLLGLIGAAPVAVRQRGKLLQTRTDRTWIDVGPFARGDHLPRLATFAGRSWLLAAGTAGGHAIPLDERGAPAGAGFDAPSNAIAHDGTRGVAVGWSAKQLELYPLTCPAT